jgi:hypothetical protein
MKHTPQLHDAQMKAIKPVPPRGTEGGAGGGVLGVVGGLMAGSEESKSKPRMVARTWTPSYWGG